MVVKSENGDTNEASNGAEEEKNPGSEKLNDDQVFSYCPTKGRVKTCCIRICYLGPNF